MMASKLGLLASFLAATFVVPGRGFAPRQQPGCPDPPPVTISSRIPQDVCIPQGFAGNPIAFFDDYSWQAFLALVWPAQTGQRGTPDPGQSVGGSGPRVFETFKAQWEIFHNDGTPPAAWEQYDTTNACAQTVGFGDVVLASFSKFSDLGQAGFGALVGPLVAQNRTYVRYATGFNRVEFEQIVANRWYLRSSLPGPGQSLVFDDNALDVKSAWIDMTDIAHPERYYTRTAWVMDPATGECSRKTVGLVGLHIVQKTPSRPQWIWSTFEQIDNVPPAAGAPGRFGFNDGSGAPMPTSNPYPIDPLTIPTPPPFNVQRVKSIHPSTHQTNLMYQRALRQQNAVWQFYQLVMTQWPLVPSSPNTPGTPNNTFPGTGTDQTAFSNVTMETFDQGNVRTGCMACHNVTRLKTDFLWALNDHAFPANVPNFLLRDPTVRELRDLLQIRQTAPASRPERLRQRPKGRRGSAQ